MYGWMNGTNSDNAISIQTMATQKMVTQKMVGRNMVIPKLEPGYSEHGLSEPGYSEPWLLRTWLLRSYLEPSYNEHNHFVVFNRPGPPVKYFILFFFSKNLKKYKRGALFNFFGGIAKLGHYE